MAFAALTGVVYSGSDLYGIGIAAEGVAIGLAVRKQGNGQLEISNAAASTTDDMAGISLATVTTGNPLPYAKPGAVITVSGGTKGVVLYLGGGADEGKSGLFSDADTANSYATLVGVYLSATQFLILGTRTGAILT